MRVVIESHWRDERWEGEIPPPADEQPALDYVFRFFNRVDESDAHRLEALDYRLPSLSVGDVVSFPPEPTRWRCASRGWEPADEPTTDLLVRLQERLHER